MASSRERLCELWMLYFAKKDLSYLQQWLEAFVTSFERVIALPSLEPRRPEEPGTEIPALPREVLQVLSQRLGHCVALGTRDGDRGTGLGQALLLLKFFIIICRNLENIQPDRSPGCLPHALRLLRLCGSQLRSFPGDKRSRAQLENGAQLEKGTQPENGTQLGSRENGAQLEKGTQLENGAQLEKGTQPENGAQLESRAQLENGMLHALHLCECFLDPYQTWRRQLSGESISAKEKSKYKFAPAPLPPEFGAFFQESFQGGKQLPETIQLRIIHLFGAILSGSKPNALQAITPAALEVLLGVLQRAGSGAPASPALLEATLRAVVAAVHVLHGSSPGAGPVSLRSLLDGFFRVLNSQLPQAAGGLIALRVLMLDAIPAMLSCQDRPVLQAVFLSNNCFEHIIRLLQNSKLYLGSSREPGEARDEVPTRNGDGLQQVSASSSDAIAVHALGVLTAIMSNSPSAKEVFKERIGYAHLYEVLRSQGQPTQRLLQELLNMAVEGDHSSFPVRPIRNEQPLLILLAWLPALECRDLQVFLSAWLRRLCEASLPSRLTCVKAGMVGSLLGALATEPALPSTCSQNLLELLRSLGSLSIRPGELRQLLRLLRRERGRGPHPYVAPVIRALSGMARGEGPPRALQSFDLSPGMAGIMVPTIQKWPGGAFAFHAWLCLSEEEPEPLARPKRRQLYSFFTAGGTGFEAFFTAGGVLVVAVCTKKDYMTVALPEFAFNDSAWHCVDIVHVAGRRPFGQNIVSIYADGHLRKTAQLRFPSLHESFTSCCIGSAGHRTTTTAAAAVSHPPAPHGPELVFTQHPVLGRSQSVPATLGPHSWTPTQLPTEGVVATTAAGSQDTEWGSPTSLEGHLGSVAIFCEALQQAQVKALFCAGPNVTSPFTLEGDLVELSGKLLLYYTPQACRNNICLDLSPSHSLDGRLTGHKVVNWDIKDVVNCVGGMGVLLPLLEQVVSKTEEPEDEQETNDLVGPELTSSRNTQGMLIPLGKSSESRLERNSVAAFLLLVKNFLRNHAVNQESLVQCHGPAIIGALLHKVPGTLLDMSTLMASQILMEQVASEGSGFLLHLLYQHLLFDFRIWSNSDFAVRLGHIQYLASVVKDHKQRIRKKYGVQFILDSIRTYYGEKTAATDDIRTVQTSLFSLVKDFFCRSFSGEEMQSLLNYLAGAQDEQQVCGALEVIHSLLKGSPAQEQLFTFLFEPGHVELLFSLLVQKRFSDEVRERVFKVLYKMLKYEKVPERSKSRLKLKDIGYHGLISYLSDIPGSMLLFRCLSEQVLGADPPNYKDLVAVVYLSHRAELSIRLDICRKLFHLIYAQQDLVKQLARLAGWQDTLTKLYVKESYECRQHSLSPAGCPELLRLSEPCGVSPPPAELQELDVFLPLGYEASDQELSEGFSDLSISPSGRTKSFHSYNFKSFDSSDRASRSSSNPGDGPPFDGVYHPLSPFSTSPFDLGLDLASTSSMATAESGTQTPASGPGTPSPLESFKPFPGMRARKSSSLSNVLDESSYQDVLPSDNVSNTSNPQQTPEEELCNLLTNIIFSVTWRGVEGWDEAAWRERGQVFSVLTKLGTACELVRPPDEIKRSLLEMMLESALTDLKESGPAALPGLTHNALKLLRLLQDFLFSEGHNNQALWSEKIYEGVSSLLDKLGVWHHLANGTSDLKEMAQTGLRVLLGYILLQDPQLHSLAYVKLHSLLQTTSAPRRDEACYLLGKLETPLRRSLDSRSETFSWLVPIIRTLMDQCYETLQLQQFLPSLPPTNGSPTFYEDFQLFCTTPEWRGFIEKHVQPTMAQFEMDTFARSHDLMSNFWNACYDAMMSSSQRREQEKAASRKLFQELVLEPAAKRCKAENARHANVLKQANNHHSTVLKQWRSLCRLLTSPRSAWADRNPPEVRWKLSSAETYSRMRLKLVPNLNFDQHLEASALRDNLGADHLQNPAESLPLAMAKEAKVSELEDDQLAEEDLPVLDNQAEPKEQNQREKLVVSEDCELITTVAVVPGRLEVTTQHVYFYDGSSEKEETEGGIGYDFKRPLSHLREVHLRRYNLRRSALELFFIDQANYFLNFRKKVRNKVYSCILGLRPPNQTYFGSRSPQELLKASGLTQKWVLREISNFEYLMQLNTIAGRTYNDLSQYPVFPWILRDYVSETLDLTNPAVFRDLSKPIGVANERHARDVKEKYESFEDPTGTVDKFHYGTHYSNAAGVMHYLIRTEPFTTLHIQLQSGRFDCSDRQFHSVPAAWQARMENPVDVKELIPEFFYFPEFLENQNGFDLGCLQLSNEKVGDVVLPRWARSREDFIQQHRKALESEYVSAHLHEWIDLIFGYKQRGPAAVEALNVFYYCTYEGAVDLDAITDETQRKALEGIISNFGQTPCQLLKEPHPARLSAESAARRLATLDTRSPNVFENLGQLKSFFVEGISDGVALVQAVVPKNQAHSFITQGSPDILVTVSANGLLGTHNWLPYDKNISNYFSFTKDPTVTNAKTQRFLQGPFAPGADLSSRTLAVSPDGKLLFSGGHWDNSLRVTSLAKGKVVGHITRHIDVVTCLSLDLCGIYLISGSRDTTCMVWQVLQQGGFSSGLAPKPVQVLYGHDAEVTCVAISTELDMAVSGSKDGTIITHTVRRGLFIRSLRPPGESCPPAVLSHLAVGPEGQVVAQTAVGQPSCSKERFALHLYSVNGKLLSSVPLDREVTAMCLTEDFVVLGTSECVLEIRELQSLRAAVPPVPMRVPVHSVSVTKEKSHILVGLEDGKLIVVGAGQPAEVRPGQFHRRLWRSTRRISQVSAGETEYNPAEGRA
ncbi:neurobeachin-like protein 2 isoform X4 [Haemorhous mexicanus]|uniref:neurobeachin-like protein 2 isoform X4 n=1 Tax=Haemorhous mexicanus TaxID=30427 RepID=UPI0028BEFD94|nr:neurobeachin-like protein 2 isoform X4 [Haemorhous mexicanus]